MDCTALSPVGMWGRITQGAWSTRTTGPRLVFTFMSKSVVRPVPGAYSARCRTARPIGRLSSGLFWFSVHRGCSYSGTEPMFTFVSSAGTIVRFPLDVFGQAVGALANAGHLLSLLGTQLPKTGIHHKRSGGAKSARGDGARVSGPGRSRGASAKIQGVRPF